MAALIRAEWFKLTRRPLTWILFAVFLALVLLQFAQFLFIALIGKGILSPEQLEQMRLRLTFPGIFGAIFGQINGIGGIFAVILAAGVIGSEYGWGTLRVSLVRQPRRDYYLFSKILTLLLLLLAAILLTLLFGSGFGLVIGSLYAPVRWPDLQTIARLPLAIIVALIVLLPYVLITCWLSIAGRSLLLGVVGGLLFQFIDIGIGAIATFAQINDTWRLIYGFLLQANVLALVSQNSLAFGLNPEAIDANFQLRLLPPLPQALLLIALYSAGFLFAAWRMFTRRDLTATS